MDVFRVMYNKIKYKVLYTCTKYFIHNLYMVYSSKYNHINQKLSHEPYGSEDYHKLTRSSRYANRSLQSIDALRQLLGDTEPIDTTMTKSKAEYLQTILINLEDIEENNTK